MMHYILSLKKNMNIRKSKKRLVQRRKMIYRLCSLVMILPLLILSGCANQVPISAPQHCPQIPDLPQDMPKQVRTNHLEVAMKDIKVLLR